MKGFPGSTGLGSARRSTVSWASLKRGQAGRDRERESERERKGQRRKAEIGKKLCGLCVSAVRNRGSLVYFLPQRRGVRGGGFGGDGR